MKRIIASTAAAVVVLLLVWVGGFDFNERGPMAFFTAFAVIYAWGFVYFFPIWNKEQR